MRDQRQEGIAHYVERAGRQVQSLADYLKNNDAGQIADASENFARRQPAVFLGVAFVLGVVSARFLKSSRRDDEQARTGKALARATTRPVHRIVHSMDRRHTTTASA